MQAIQEENNKGGCISILIGGAIVSAAIIGWKLLIGS